MSRRKRQDVISVRNVTQVPCSRSFYVGEAVNEEDVHAKYEDGILKISVPKKEPEKIEKNGYISIEG